MKLSITLSMSWDVVALRDIRQNETIQVLQPVVDGNDPLSLSLQLLYGSIGK
jgi:hypothetical protein